MKKIYLFFILLFIAGCESNRIDKNYNTISCPSVLFSSNDNLYLGTSDNDFDLKNLIYKSEINNAQFLNGCFNNNGIFRANLSILFTSSPSDEKTIFDNSIILPFYVATLNQDKKLIDIQYYSFNGKFNRDPITDDFIDTDLSNTILIQNKFIESNSIILLGFMLDKKRIEFSD